MALFEEVFQNGDKWYGASSGREYSKSETEEKGCCRWSKPSFAATGEIVLEIESDGQSLPSGNGKGKAGC